MNLDLSILFWINSRHTAWLDMLMWGVSRVFTWIPLYMLLIGLIAARYRDGRTVLFILLAFALAVGLSDFTTSSLLKPLVARLRPTHEPQLAGMLHIVNGYTGGLYGFCSSHAANTMAVGLLFSLLYRNRIATLGLMTWVAINCYSRIYLAVHYPSDILCGLAIGAMFAWLVWLVTSRYVLPWVSSRSRRADGGAARQGGS